MKKGLKIALIVISAVIVGGGGAFLAVGGKPYLDMADRDYPDNAQYIAVPYPYADRTVPEDFIPLTYGEWTVSAPVQLESMYQKPEDAEIKKRMFNAKYGDNQSVTVIFTVSESMGEVDLTGASKDGNTVATRLRDFVLNGYAKNKGYTLDNWYNLEDFLYHLKREDAGISYRSGMAYYSFAMMQSKMLWPNAWEFHTDNADGFIQVSILGEDEETDRSHRCRAYVDVFPKSDPNTICTAILASMDEDTLYQMINSLQLDPSRIVLKEGDDAE